MRVKLFSEIYFSFTRTSCPFHDLEYIFHDMERIFQTMEYTFHIVEQRLPPPRQNTHTGEDGTIALLPRFLSVCGKIYFQIKRFNSPAQSTVLVVAMMMHQSAADSGTTLNITPPKVTMRICPKRMTKAMSQNPPVPAF